MDVSSTKLDKFFRMEGVPGSLTEADRPAPQPQANTPVTYWSSTPLPLPLLFDTFTTFEHNVDGWYMLN